MRIDLKHVRAKETIDGGNEARDRVAKPDIHDWLRHWRVKRPALADPAPAAEPQELGEQVLGLLGEPAAQVTGASSGKTTFPFTR